MDDKSFNDERVALDWIKTIESDGAKVRETDIYPRLQEWINSIYATNVLDIGSGQGICADKLNLEGRTYTGVEPSLHLIHRAKELYSRNNRSFVLGDIYNLPFSEGTFEAAFSVTVWHLLADLHRAATELSRVLKIGGHFFIITANPGAYSLWTGQYTETSQEGRRFEGKQQIQDGGVLFDVLYLHTLDEILDSLLSAGLTITKTETFREKTAGQKQFVSIQGRR